MAGQCLFHLALIQPIISMVVRLGWKPQEGISQVSDGLVLLVGLPHSKEDEVVRLLTCKLPLKKEEAANSSPHALG